VFQRTPSSIDVRGNHPIDAEWFATLQPGWQQEWLENFTILQTGGFAEKDLVQDGWTDITKRVLAKFIEMNPEERSVDTWLAAFRESDDEKMEEIRARVDAVVADPDTAEALKPWYRQLCKRPCFHDEYLQAYNNPNVTLVDTDGKGVREITETGVWVGDVHHELDCIIYASGFEVGTSYQRRSGYDAIGHDGRRLSDHWADGMRSMHGMHVHGFPNLYVIGPTQAANLISNIPHNLIEAAHTLAAILDHGRGTGARAIEVTADAEQAWMDLLRSGNRRFGADPDCTPGYYNNEGKVDEIGDGLAGLGYPEGPAAYFGYIKGWRDSGEFAGLEFR